MLINTTAQLTLFCLVLMRMAGFVLLNPVLGRQGIPARYKAGLIFILALAIYSYTQGSAFDIDSSLVFGAMLAREFFLGFVLGFVMELFFLVVTFAGYVIDFQLGLSMAMAYDPQNQAQVAVTGRVFQTWLMLLFFAVDGHLALMKIIMTSAEIIPYGGIVVTQGLSQKIIDIFLECIMMGVKLAIPIIAAEFLIEVGVGILSKVVPQITIFVINIQVKLIVGIGLLVIMFSPFSEYMEKIITTMMKTMQGILTFAG